MLIIPSGMRIQRGRRTPWVAGCSSTVLEGEAPALEKGEEGRSGFRKRTKEGERNCEIFTRALFR